MNESFCLFLKIKPWETRQVDLVAKWITRISLTEELSLVPHRYIGTAHNCQKFQLQGSRPCCSYMYTHTQICNLKEQK